MNMASKVFIDNLRKMIKEEKYQEVIESISIIKEADIIKDESLAECKINALAGLGKQNEAYQFSQKLPSESNAKKRFENFWKFSQNKPEPEELKKLNG